MRVLCDVDFTENGVNVNCSRCGNTAYCGGQTEKSVRRGMVMLKETCPNAEKNYYFTGGQELAQAAPTPAGPVRLGTPMQPSPALVKTHPSAAESFAKLAQILGQGTVAVPAAPEPVALATPARAALAPPGAATLIETTRFAVIKTATTGLKTDQAMVCEIGLRLVDFGRPMWRAALMVNPGVPIPQEASALHGITNAMTQASPIGSAVGPELDRLIEDRVMLGWNLLKFDWPILQRCTGVQDRKLIDVLVLERKYSEEIGLAQPGDRHSMTDALARWGIEASPTYDPLHDAKLVWALFYTMCARVPQLAALSADEAVDVCQGELYAWSMMKRAPIKQAYAGLDQ